MGQQTENLREMASDIPKLLLFDETPAWMQADPLIRRGYRSELKSVAKCFHSLTYVHNETVNAWSHLLPALLHSGVLLWEGKLPRRGGPSKPSYSDKKMVHIYILTAVICLLSSAVYHVMNAHSKQVARRVLKLDYIGIVFNTAGGCISSTWFGFRERPVLRDFWITTTLGLSILVLYFLLRPEADGKSAALWRTVLFGALLSTLYLPMLQSYVGQGSLGLQHFPVAAAITTNSFYIIGVIFYISRVPERFFPERFDIWGSSHQIFHVFVMLGQINYVRGLRAQI